MTLQLFAMIIAERDKQSHKTANTLECSYILEDQKKLTIRGVRCQWWGENMECSRQGQYKSVESAISLDHIGAFAPFFHSYLFKIPR